ncbi:MAG: M42 family peptidase, partial [Cyanobacteria bacterium P01_E01_bin.34]
MPLLKASASSDAWFNTIHQLVMCHSPSGMESEVDRWILNYLANLPNVKSETVWQDSSSNIVVKISGRDSSKSVAITAHKDEIGAIVKEIEGDGQIAVRRLGGSYPWVYGEGVMDILGDRKTVQGVLSFGSRHVSHESPQKAQQDDRPVSWSEAWVATKLSAVELDKAGVRPGTRVVVGKHRKAPVRLGDFIGSYTLDNKASVAILLAIAARLTEPAMDTYLIFSAKEEVGALGA